MSLFDWCVIMHLIGDWILQTEYQALNKAKGKFFNSALWVHCLVYTACFIPVVILAGIGWWSIALIFVSHLFLDRRWPIVWIRRVLHKESEKSIVESWWLTIVVDQVVHILILALIAGVYSL